MSILPTLPSPIFLAESVPPSEQEPSISTLFTVTPIYRTTLGTKNPLDGDQSRRITIQRGQEDYSRSLVLQKLLPKSQFCILIYTVFKGIAINRGVLAGKSAPRIGKYCHLGGFWSIRQEGVATSGSPVTKRSFRHCRDLLLQSLNLTLKWQELIDPHLQDHFP